MSDPSYFLPPPPLPTFVPTPITTLTPLIQTLHTNHHTQRSPHSLTFRLTQLKRLYWALEDIQPLARAALTSDIGRAEFENHFADFLFVKDELLKCIKNLRSWVSDEPATEVPWYLRFANEAYVRKDPLGVVLVIGAWNYPWNLNLLPFIGAMAAGNSVVLKPSEVSPMTAAVLRILIEDVAMLDKDYYRVVLGGVAETTELLKCKFDKICFTGSTDVGRIVMKAAAEHLTPVLLELGGKNPCIITPSADIPLAARRIAWAKTLNAGQSCTAPDYILLPESMEDDFITHFSAALAEFYPGGVTPSTADYTRIVNHRHFDRLTTLLSSTAGEIKLGGKILDRDARLFETTLVKLPDTPDWESDALMRGEIFGPILTYKTYKPTAPSPTATGKPPTQAQKAQALLAPLLAILKRNSDTSLGAYIFSTHPTEQDLFLSHTRSGGACINEAFMNTFIAGLPFGGVGNSGMGCYRGKYSVDAFVHRRSVVRNRAAWTDWVVSGWRFPPFGKAKFRIVAWMAERPGFARVGKQVTVTPMVDAAERARL